MGQALRPPDMFNRLPFEDLKGTRQDMCASVRTVLWHVTHLMEVIKSLAAPLSTSSDCVAQLGGPA